MSTRVAHTFTLVATVNLLSGCPSDPCDENPNSIFCTDGGADITGGDETGIEIEHCAPLSPDEVGYKYECQGKGNGWLELSVHPIGPLPLQCVNWGEGTKPTKPTSEDCAPLDFAELPGDISRPGACCTDDATSPYIMAQCDKDCGFAACTLAVQKLRDGALALPTTGAKGVMRLDLFYLANMLEMPDFLKECATNVTDANGEPVAIVLGAGASGIVPGHIEDLTIHLQCALDDAEPYLTTGDTCDTAPNIPFIEAASNMGGLAATGAVTIFAPNNHASADLYDITFAFTQTYNNDGSNGFVLAQFTAESAPVSYAGFALTHPSIRLVAPAHGTVLGETVSFPPGALRMEVTATIAIDGEPLFDANPISAEYLNSAAATASRKPDDTFAFIEVPFEAGGYQLILNTEAGSFQPR